MKRPAKTYPVIRWVDGSTSVVHKVGRWYKVRVPWTPTSHGGEAGTDSMQGIEDLVADHGATLERVPNPHYEKQLEAFRAYEARREVKRLLGFDI